MLGKRGGIDKIAGGAAQFCGLFHPKLMDLMGGSPGLSLYSLFAPASWDLSSGEKIVSVAFGYWIGTYGLCMVKMPGMLWR